MTKIQELLFKNKDYVFKEFHANLIPTVNKDIIIGVRTPILRKLAKELYKKGNFGDFLSSLPHLYYEENQLHAFILEQVKDFNDVINKVDIFLSYIDNWATCDSMKVKIFDKNKDKLLPYIHKWIKSNEVYRIRYAIGLLMKYFLKESFKKDYLKLVSSIKSEEYYVWMMQSWFFTEALVKQYESTIIYLENNLLSTWVHNKTIQKAIESFRINKQVKEYLKSLRK